MGVVIALSPGPGRFLSVATSVLSMDHRGKEYGIGMEMDERYAVYFTYRTTTPYNHSMLFHPGRRCRCRHPPRHGRCVSCVISYMRKKERETVKRQ